MTQRDVIQWNCGIYLVFDWKSGHETQYGHYFIKLNQTIRTLFYQTLYLITAKFAETVLQYLYRVRYERKITSLFEDLRGIRMELLDKNIEYSRG